MGDKPVKVRAVVYRVGAMGAVLTRMLLDKDVEIVGAVGRDPQKVGRDLEELAGLARTLDVTVESDPRRALAGGTDIAVVSVASDLDVMRERFAIKSMVSDSIDL